MEPALSPCEVLYERRCARYIYVVPDGLRELMSDISREVLRCQPLQYYTFIADYLDSLMITRENARVAAKFVEGLAETGEIVGELLYRLDITREQAERAAKVIQRAFRRHLREIQDSDEALDEDNIIERIIKRAKITREQANVAATTIQTAYRIHRQRRRDMYDISKIDWRIAARNTIGSYRNANVSTAECCEAATLIKAAYKGYYTRKLIKHLKAVEADPLYYVHFYEDYYTKMMTSEVDPELLALKEKVLKAVSIIQRTYRRYRERCAEHEKILQEKYASQDDFFAMFETKVSFESEEYLGDFEDLDIEEHEQELEPELEGKDSVRSSIYGLHHENVDAESYEYSYEHEEFY